MSANQPRHNHDFSLNTERDEKRVWLVFWLTTITMVIEVSAGIWFGSMALLADGWHMGTHATAFAVTLFAYGYARRHRYNPAFSFGTGKITYLGGFASAIALGVVAMMMAVESVHRLMEPVAIRFNEALLVAAIGLGVNLLSMVLLHNQHDDHDHHHSDHNLRAAYLHVLADTLTSVLAIIALIVGKFLGWLWLDALMGIVGGIVIAYWAYGLIKESSAVLLDKNPSRIDVSRLREAFEAKGEYHVSDFHFWKIAPHHTAAIIALETNDPRPPDYYKKIAWDCGLRVSHLSVEVNRLENQTEDR